MSRALSSSIGRRRIATSLSTSTVDAAEADHHERPELRVLAHAEDELEPLDHLLHEKAVDPRAAGGATIAACVIASAAVRTAAASARPSATPPTSVLWLASGETIFNATGKPMSAAFAAAASGVLAGALRGGIKSVFRQQRVEGRAFQILLAPARLARAARRRAGSAAA